MHEREEVKRAIVQQATNRGLVERLIKNSMKGKGMQISILEPELLYERLVLAGPATSRWPLGLLRPIDEKGEMWLRDAQFMTTCAYDFEMASDGKTASFGGVLVSEPRFSASDFETLEGRIAEVFGDYPVQTAQRAFKIKEYLALHVGPESAVEYLEAQKEKKKCLVLSLNASEQAARLFGRLRGRSDSVSVPVAKSAEGMHAFAQHVAAAINLIDEVGATVYFPGHCLLTGHTRREPIDELHMRRSAHGNTVYLNERLETIAYRSASALHDAVYQTT